MTPYEALLKAAAYAGIFVVCSIIYHLFKKLTER